ncbi:MAG: hypothetical protein MK295_10400, partial [Pseudomonadales bacterium]|nr:hypothetical protein [Pseudomonadales bacterium]
RFFQIDLMTRSFFLNICLKAILNRTTLVLSWFIHRWDSQFIAVQRAVLALILVAAMRRRCGRTA